LQIVSEAIDDLGPPPFGVLTLKNVPADRPVQQDQFPVDGQGGPNLGAPDARFELLQELGIAGGRNSSHSGHHGVRPEQ
jgi:hypothetical protein